MERQDAERTILEVEQVRRDTRHALNPVWFGNLAFGAFFLGTAVLGFAGAGAEVATTALTSITDGVVSDAWTASIGAEAPPSVAWPAT